MQYHFYDKTKYLNIIFMIFFIAGCSTTSHIRPELSTDINYQKDLKMIVTPQGGHKKTIYGMGVIPKAKNYKIRIEPPGKADMITVLSCHREVKTPNPKRKGGWFKKKYYEFDVWPDQQHEIDSACSFDAGVYEKEKGRHAWGLVVVENDLAKLEATTKCNGRTTVYGGTSVCQAKAGLIQSIHFDRPVIASEVPGCVLETPKDGRNWVYTMPKNECIIYFVDSKDPNNFHKSVTFGYDTIPIRGVE